MADKGGPTGCRHAAGLVSFWITKTRGRDETERDLGSYAPPWHQLWPGYQPSISSSIAANEHLHHQRPRVHAYTHRLRRPPSEPPRWKSSAPGRARTRRRRWRRLASAPRSWRSSRRRCGRRSAQPRSEARRWRRSGRRGPSSRGGQLGAGECREGECVALVGWEERGAAGAGRSACSS